MEARVFPRAPRIAYSMTDPPERAPHDDPTLVSSTRRPEDDTLPGGQGTNTPARRASDVSEPGGLSVAVPEPGAETLTSRGLYSRGAEVSRGGMGRVSLAWDHNLQRQVAVKEMLPAHRGDDEAGERFLREAFLTGGLEHPGVVPVHHFGMNAAGLPFYTMKYISGQTLGDAIRALADVPTREVDFRRFQLLQRVHLVCQAIAFAHTHGVVHRDIKPSNIMLGDYGETVVLDWGVAKRLEEHQIPEPCPDEDGQTASSPLATADPKAALEAALDAALDDPTPTQTPRAEASGPQPSSGGLHTRAGDVVGTPAYMPPEQAQGDLARLGPTADVFSLGATLYCVVTGRAPYAGLAPTELLQAAAAAQFPRPRHLAPATPPALETIICRAMAPDPAQRYPSACELAEDLERFLTGQLVEAHQYTVLERIVNWYRRYRVAVLSMLLLGIATNAVAVTVGGVHLTRTLRGMLLWLADAQVQRSLVLAEEWLVPVQGALGLVEDVAQRYGADRAQAEPALATVRRSIDNVELVYYTIPDGPGWPVSMGSDPTRSFPTDVDPRTRPWYPSAVAARGAFVVSDPYPDINTGRTSVTVSRLIRLPRAPDLEVVVGADMELQPLTAYLLPQSFAEEGAAVLLTAVDRTVPYPACWDTAKPILVASTLDRDVFDAPRPDGPTIDPDALDRATQDAAQRLVTIIQQHMRPTSVLDLNELLRSGSYDGAQELTVRSALRVDIAGHDHAVFTAPVPGVPWDVSVVLPMASLSRPFTRAAGIVVRTAGGGFLITCVLVMTYYRVRRRHRPGPSTYPYPTGPPTTRP